MNRNRTWTAALFLGVAAGCASPVDHRFQTDLVARKGPEAAKREIASILERCEKPRVATAEADDNYIDYTVGRASGPLLRIAYSDVRDVVVYDNHFVFVHFNRGGPKKLLFPSETDAIGFADLLMSFRQWRSARAAPSAPGAAAPAAPAAPPPGTTAEIQPPPSPAAPPPSSPAASPPPAPSTPPPPAEGVPLPGQGDLPPPDEAPR